MADLPMLQSNENMNLSSVTVELERRKKGSIFVILKKGPNKKTNRKVVLISCRSATYNYLTIQCLLGSSQIIGLVLMSNELWA